MAQVNLIQPQIGQPDTTEDPKIQNAFTAIVAAINGNLDSTNIAASLAQSATVNQSGQTVKGASIVATSESRTNVAYGTLTTPDQVTGVVLPANGLIVVWYQAVWQESVAGAARAALFIGANQQKMTGLNAPLTAAAGTGSTTAVNAPTPLFSTPLGLGTYFIGSASAPAYSGDVTTGQAIGGFGGIGLELSGSVANQTALNPGPVYIEAAAGTYTVSVQFKASSGSVTALNRKLWVQAISFA